MHNFLPEPHYQVSGRGGGMTISEYYYRQRPSRLNLLVARLKDWWRPPTQAKIKIDPMEHDRQIILVEIRTKLLAPPASKN